MAGTVVIRVDHLEPGVQMISIGPLSHSDHWALLGAARIITAIISESMF